MRTSASDAGSNPAIGGQAVIEGVMMRSPKSLTVVCRRPDGSIAVKEDQWRSLWAQRRVLRWPLLRGSLVLLEAMVNGVAALSFSSSQQLAGAGSADPPKDTTSAGTVTMLVISLLVGLVLFVSAPHLLAWGLGGFLGVDATSPTFHVMDGAIKLVIFVGYIAAISRLEDVQRVFQYHGAEHKAIFAYEAGLPLTVENARRMSRFHPRCGTSFLLIVIGVSALLFSLLLGGRWAQSPTVDHLLKILVKMPLMFPVAGLSYELIKLAGARADTSRLARMLSTPGMWLQRISTREPDEGQLEIALISIRKTLWREAQGGNALPLSREVYEVFISADEVDLPLVA